MATIITTECISCGACEPECPNNAISQGETIFIIDPQLCTECVGFHDYEACAAVCPVDCCVTDPNNVESEEALIARARALHPDTQFGDNFESRFRKGQAKPAGAATRSVASAQATSTTHHTSAQSGVGATPTATPTAAEYIGSEMKLVQLPEVDSWNIPVRCYKCQETHVESVRNFMVGNVIFCPHCNKSMVVRDNLNFHIRSLLKDFYEKWDKEQREFKRRREKELAEFTQNRAKEAQAFESHQQRELEKISQQLQALGNAYDAPGKPIKKGSRFAWG
jgi:NAD-dependent dihydropyrimidine dehydrogenase PreA subunit